MGLLFFGRTNAGNTDVKTGILGLTFYFIFYLCILTWSDFYNIGERMRDFSFLSTVVNNPVSPTEPWMSGYPIHYYLYWYRLGEYFQRLLNLETYQTYHQLLAFGFTFFFCMIFEFLLKILKLTPLSSLWGTILICLGSNVEGLRYIWTSNLHWWGASRVLPNTINEFPAWSLLLSDFHPHVMNYGLLIFFILLIGSLIDRFKFMIDQKIQAVFLAALSFCFILSSNTWDAPFWLGFCIIFGCGFMLIRSEITFISMKLVKIAPYLFIYSLVFFSLVLTLNSISIGAAPFTFGYGRFDQTLMLDFLRHWGLPFFLVLMSFVLLAKTKKELIGKMFLFLGLLLIPVIWPILVGLLIILMIKVWSEFKDQQLSIDDWLFYAIGFSVFGILLVCEFFYFDDIYVGKLERFNTLFKVNSCIWPFFYIFSFFLVKKAMERVKKSAPLVLSIRAVQSIVVVLFCSFFILQIEKRPLLNKKINYLWSKENQEGLTYINQQFPGSREIIRKLKKIKSGTVLEQALKAYDLNGHISIFSGFPSYLISINHMNIITRNYKMINHRRKMVAILYREQNCANLKRMLKEEKIDYMVVGPEEKRMYQITNDSQFHCMEKTLSNNFYSIYSI